MKNIAIMFSGTGSNMESIISKSFYDKLDVSFIAITDNPQAEGIAKAEKYNIPVFIIPAAVHGWRINTVHEAYINDLLNGKNVDYILLAGFMKIISSNIIERFKNRIINIHPALLPSFKGKNAQKQAFEYGAKVSGCTVHFVDKGIDTGPIIAQRAVYIGDCRNDEEVFW